MCSLPKEQDPLSHPVKRIVQNLQKYYFLMKLYALFSFSHKPYVAYVVLSAWVLSNMHGQFYGKAEHIFNSNQEPTAFSMKDSGLQTYLYQSTKIHLL